MNEDQLRAGLRAAVADEPPLGFDPDQAAEHAHLRLRRRRTVFASTAATVVAMIAVATTVTLIRGDDGSPVGPPDGAGTPQERLANQVAQLLTEVEPSARDIEIVDVMPAPDEPYYYMGGNIDYVDSAGEASLLFDVKHAGDPDFMPGQCRELPELYGCATYPQPDGTNVYVITAPYIDEITEFYRRAIYVSADLKVTLEVEYDQDGSGPYQDEFPLDDEQLVQLATDPGMAPEVPLETGQPPPAWPTETWITPTNGDLPDDPHNLRPDAQRIAEHFRPVLGELGPTTIRELWVGQDEVGITGKLSVDGIGPRPDQQAAVEFSIYDFTHEGQFGRDPVRSCADLDFQEGCQEYPQPDGTTVVVTTTKFGGLMAGEKRAYLVVDNEIRAVGGTYGSNYIPPGTDFDELEMIEEVPLTDDQLIELVTDPELHLTP